MPWRKYTPKDGKHGPIYDISPGVTVRKNHRGKWDHLTYKRYEGILRVHVLPHKSFKWCKIRAKVHTKYTPNEKAPVSYRGYS